jgi:hypothetical protein
MLPTPSLHASFPDIVADLNNTSNTESVAHFDGTLVAFENSGLFLIRFLSGAQS